MVFSVGYLPWKQTLLCLRLFSCRWCFSKPFCFMHDNLLSTLFTCSSAVGHWGFVWALLQVAELTLHQLTAVFLSGTETGCESPQPLVALSSSLWDRYLPVSICCLRNVRESHLDRVLKVDHVNISSVSHMNKKMGKHKLMEEGFVFLKQWPSV